MVQLVRRTICLHFAFRLALLSISHLVVSASAEPTAAVQVLYAPTSIALKPTEASLKSSDYSKFVSLCLGLSTDNVSWHEIVVGFVVTNSNMFSLFIFTAHRLEWFRQVQLLQQHSQECGHLCVVGVRRQAFLAGFRPRRGMLFIDIMSLLNHTMFP